MTKPRIPKTKRRVRRAAKQLMRAVRKDLRAALPRSPITGETPEPPAQMLFQLAVGALMGAMHKATCPASRQPSAPTPFMLMSAPFGMMPPMRSPIVGGGMPSSVVEMPPQQMSAMIEIADPSPGARQIAADSFRSLFDRIMADAPNDDERARISAAIVNGAFRGIIDVVWPHATKRAEPRRLQESFHIVLGDALAAHLKDAATPLPGGARGPSGGSADAA